MASSFNLIRDSRVFFTTNVNAFGVVQSTGFLSGAYGTGNTWEIQVQDGFSFSQNTTTETVTLNEAGATPNRGQRNFNTALEAVDFSFSTYIRPRNTGSVIDAEEGVLWNAMFSSTAIPSGSATTNAWQPAAGSAVCSLTNSGKHQLQQFGLIISLGGTAFVIDNCVMDTATIDFGLDAIASIAWAGKGSTLRQLGNSPVITQSGTVVTFAPTTTSLSFAGIASAVNASTGVFTCAATSLVVGASVVFSGTNTGTGVVANGTYYIISTNGSTTFSLSSTLGGSAISLAGLTTGTIIGQTATYTAPDGITGTANFKNTTAPYLANKLSTVYIDDGISVGGTQYTVALTGGNLTFANNVTYLTPANLGVVNAPIVYFTGTRAVSGTMNAYLRTGNTNTAGLLASMLANSATSTNPAFYMKLSIGGTSAAACRVDVEMPAVMLTIPTVATEQVVSTTISFTAQGSASGAFDIEQLNEATITYIA
jgi:hypothetical protein